MSVFKKALSLLVGDVDDLAYLKLPKNSGTKKLRSERELIQLESKIGSEIFGPVPKGRRREFFCLDENTYIWYESYKDEAGKEIESTTRYEIQGDKILKAQSGARYSYIEGDELENLARAVDIYHDRVLREVYQQSGQASLAPAS